MILNLGCGDDHRGDIRIDIREYKTGLNLIADAHNLPLRKNAVDYVLCQNVFEHLWNPFKSLLDMVRVSRRDIVIVIPNVYHFKRVIGAILNRNYGFSAGTLHLQAWDLLCMKYLVGQIEALRIKKVTYNNFRGRFRWPSVFFGYKMVVTMRVKENRQLEEKAI